MQDKKIKILKNILSYGYTARGEHLFFCPYCKHHKPKLSVNVEKNVFKCWVCDTHGKNIFSVIKRFGSPQQIAEWSSVDGKTNISEFDNIFVDKVSEETKQVIHLPEEFISLTNKRLPKTALPATNYLINRGISEEDILKWKIGYCSSGDYENRIIIPSFNNDGDVNYYISRTYSNHWMRYKNPPVSRDIIFNELCIDWRQDVVIVEGVFDAIKADNAIPILGSTIREKSRLFQKIVKHSPDIYFALDADAEKKAMSIMRKFSNYGIEVYKIPVPSDKDVGDMSKEEFQQRKSQAQSLDTDICFMEMALSMV
tara:strand:- start:2377 stop:3312 length:936 start_codon:yes stop_codon:yes gene_type:complete